MALLRTIGLVQILGFMGLDTGGGRRANNRRMLIVRLLPLALIALVALASSPDCRPRPPGQHGDCLYLPGISPGSDYVSGGGPPSVPTATATPASSYWEVAGGEYSHGGGCAPDSEIDPITTILLSNEGGHSDARDQIEDSLSAAELDNGANEFINRQRYRDFGACVEGEITQATEDQYCVYPVIPCAEEQRHTRCNVVSQASPYGYWASCTPHWDEETSDTNCSSWHNSHYVPAVWAGHGNEANWGNWDGSGFDAARDWLWWQLVHLDGMTFIGYVNFDNTRPMQQCNLEWSHADGKVNVIQLG